MLLSWPLSSAVPEMNRGLKEIVFLFVERQKVGAPIESTTLPKRTLTLRASAPPRDTLR